MQREVSPIPPGRYWIEVVGKQNRADFANWLREMAGAVRVESSSLDQSGPKSVEFVIFNVPGGRMPFLNALQFGFPNHAPAEITAQADVIQSPVTPGALEQAQALAEKAAEGAGQVAGLALLALLFLLTSRN